jgi:general secretion pathway protein A
VRLLSNFETDREKLVQIILAGQPELRRKLALPRLEPLSQRIVIDHHLEPLRPFEVRLYLEHRLRVAGGRFEQVFDPGCETTFFGFSVGCPRLVSALADRALLAAYAQGLRPVPRALVEAKAKELDSARPDELWEADVWEC